MAGGETHVSIIKLAFLFRSIFSIFYGIGSIIDPIASVQGINPLIFQKKSIFIINRSGFFFPFFGTNVEISKQVYDVVSGIVALWGADCYFGF